MAQVTFVRVENDETRPDTWAHRVEIKAAILYARAFNALDPFH